MIRSAVATVFFCFIVLLSSSVFAEPKLVAADDKRLLYTGRIDFSDKKAPRLSWPGSSIKANFTGNYLELVLDDQKGKNFFNVIVDGENIHPHVLQAAQGEKSYWISSSLGEGEHSLEIYKRTEGSEGSTAFKGLKLAENAKLLAPPARPKRRIEIYGDSISSGMGNEGPDNGVDHLEVDKNNYWAYGAIAARELNAELHTISRSGIGIMISWFDFIMPQYYDQLSAVGDNDSVWDFKQWTPDVVLINLMQNDSWLVDREKRLQPIPSDEQRVQAYVDFIQKVRAEYPKAQLICALGSMDATSNEKWPNYIRAAVKQLQDSGDKRIDSVFFEFNGYGQHPRIAQHKKNAAKLSAFIRKKMAW